MNNYTFGSASNSPKSFNAYPRGDFDIELGTSKKARKPKTSTRNPLTMIKSFASRFNYYTKSHPVLIFCIFLSFGITVLIVLAAYESHYRVVNSYRNFNKGVETYPFPKLKNLVMVAGHSVYTSSNCGKVDKEDSWFLESYQKHPGQASSFVTHIQEGVEIVAKDEEALLLFSGGETRRDAGPRSEAQSYWTVAESKGWFGQFLIFSIFISFS